MSENQVEALVTDFRAAGLPPAEIAMLEFAEKVTLGAYRVTDDDVAGLRRHGFSDAEILDIAFAAAARNFYSRMVDAAGARPDPEYEAMDERLRKALAVGRPVGDSAP